MADSYSSSVSPAALLHHHLRLDLPLELVHTPRLVSSNPLVVTTEGQHLMLPRMPSKLVGQGSSPRIQAVVLPAGLIRSEMCSARIWTGWAILAYTLAIHST